MILAKTTDILLTQSEMLQNNITSVLDNFETNTRVYYQGDEPIVETQTEIVE